MTTDPADLDTRISFQPLAARQDGLEDHAERRLVRPGLFLAYLFASSGVLAFGLALVPALATTFRSIHGLSGGQVGNLHNLKDLGAIVLVLAGATILHRIGLVAALNSAVVAGLAGCGALLVVPGMVGLLLGMFLHGAAFSLGMMTIVTMLFRLPVAYQRISAVFATYGVASFLAPAAVALLATPARGYAPVYILYAVVLVLILVAGVLLGWAQGPRRNDGASAESARFLSKAQLRFWAPDLAAYSALMAAETIVEVWITSLAQYTYAASMAAASVLLSTLWIIHTGVRAWGDVLARWLSPRRVVLVGSVVGTCGTTIACMGNMTLAYIGMAIFAIGVAALIPVYQGWMLSQVPSHVHPPMNAALCIGGTISVTTMVWLTGLAVDVDTRLPFAIAVALILLVVVRVARVPQRASGSDPQRS